MNGESTNLKQIFEDVEGVHLREKLFLYQYYSLKPDRRDDYLAEVVVMNASVRGSTETE